MIRYSEGPGNSRRRMMLTASTPLAFALALLLSVPPAYAQRISPEMKLLDFMVGEWKGAGWIEMGQGHPQTFSMKQTVTRRGGGGVIIIEGLGTEGFPGQPERFIIYHPFAVIAFDWKEKVFRLRAFRAEEGLMDAVPTVRENFVVWEYRENFMRRKVRFTITLNPKQQWFEIRELSSDEGKSWRKFFEMTLDRITSS